MRVELAQLNNERRTFVATFEKFGKKKNRKIEFISLTLLLTNLKLEGSDEELTDHIWMNLGKQFEKLDLQSGDTLKFDARVGPYEKGYSEDDDENPKRIDYGLSRPTKTIKIGRAEGDWDGPNAHSRNVLEEVKQHNRFISDLHKKNKLIFFENPGCNKACLSCRKCERTEGRYRCNLINYEMGIEPLFNKKIEMKAMNSLDYFMKGGLI